MQQPANEVTPVINSDFPGFFDQPFELNSQTGQSDKIDVSVNDAAQLLGITERTVWRRIKQKKLISRLELGRTIVTLKRSDTTVIAPDSDSVDVTTVTDQTDNESNLSDKALTLVSELSAKLEGATYRIGYLEAQAEGHKLLLPDLEARAKEVDALRAEVARLNLELELQKSSRWQRFVNWFMGAH